MSPSANHRYDARAKVMGVAQYAGDFSVPGQVHAFMVQSTIAHGTIESIDTAAAEHAYGVVTVLTPFNTPKLPSSARESAAGRRLSLLHDAEIQYNGQPIAIIVANTLDQARHAATLLRTMYRPQPALLDFTGRLNEARTPKEPGRDAADSSRGDLTAGFAKADIVLDETYTTSIQNHNSMEPHATLAWWEGESLNVYDSTQSISTVRQTLADTLGISVSNIRVRCPYTGGGFGSKGTTWSHVALAAIASKAVGKPVRLVLDRNQMFGPVGSRPATVQKIRLGASSDGRLLAVQHDVILHTSVMEDFLEPCAVQTRMLYASAANATTHRLVDMHLGVTTHMRGPGEATGTAAFESALDELAIELKMDPVQLRVMNYAEIDLGKNLPFTSKRLRECYTQASERFGWARRNTTPGQRLEGNELIGCGMATATRHATRSAAEARVRLLPNGRALVASGTQELGTGMYTIMAGIVAETLALDLALIDVELGDTSLPQAPGSVGSQSAASVCPAVQKAALEVRKRLLNLAITDQQSHLCGMKSEDLSVRNGSVISQRDSAVCETYVDLLARNAGKPIEAEARTGPGEERASHSANSFGAVFAEVAVDRDTSMARVRRVVGTYDIGTLMNDKTGRNQLIGGIVWGISFALYEQAHIDPAIGRTVNENFAGYHVPVNADIGEIDVTVLDIPDDVFNPLGARGIGEIGITGVAAAIANAIYNATSKRVRDFPITPDKIMQAPIA